MASAPAACNRPDRGRRAWQGRRAPSSPRQLAPAASVGRVLPSPAAAVNGGRIGQTDAGGVHRDLLACWWPSNGITSHRPGSSCWQQDRHHGRRTVWPPWRRIQNPAGRCWQWTHSWIVCGSRPGVATLRHQDLGAVVAGQVCTADPARWPGRPRWWPAATLAAAATSGMRRPAKPSRPVIWFARGSAVPGDPVRRACGRRVRRMRFMTISLSCCCDRSRPTVGRPAGCPLSDVLRMPEAVRSGVT